MTPKAEWKFVSAMSGEPFVMIIGMSSMPWQFVGNQDSLLQVWCSYMLECLYGCMVAKLLIYIHVCIYMHVHVLLYIMLVCWFDLRDDEVGVHARCVRSSSSKARLLRRRHWPHLHVHVLLYITLLCWFDLRDDEVGVHALCVRSSSSKARLLWRRQWPHLHGRRGLRRE